MPFFVAHKNPRYIKLGPIRTGVLVIWYREQCSLAFSNREVLYLDDHKVSTLRLSCFALIRFRTGPLVYLIR